MPTLASARTRRAIAAGFVLALTATACSGSNGKITLAGKSPSDPSTGSESTGGASTVSWESCRTFDIAVSDATKPLIEQAKMKCAWLEVPVQHAEPDGPTLKLALARVPATGPKDQRIGSLVINPGGPGGSGLEFLANAALVLPPEFRQRFDLVSFDPRGIALSTPVNCLSEDRRKSIVEADTPDDPAAQVAQAVGTEEEIAKGCAKAPDDLELHMGTDEVAGDLDAIRAAVGDEQLTYLGLSYGTRIGAAYANQFPDKIRALVLDGSVTPSRDLVDQSAGQIKGIARALNSFVSMCNQDATCPLAPDAMTRIDAVAAQVDTTPLDVTTGSKAAKNGVEQLDKDQFVTGLVTALYDPSALPALAEAIEALGGSDPEKAQTAGKFLLDLAGQQNSQRDDGTYGNGFETQSIVNCLDADGPLETSELPSVRAKAGPLPAVLDTDPATDSPSCTALATGDQLKMGATPAKDKVLIVGTVGDPATPIEWTDELAAALGGPAVLRYEGNGHTASTRIQCVTTQVASFLDEATVPATLSDCPRDPSESDIYAALAKQFESLGLGDGVGTCVAEKIRGELDPLEIMGLNSEEPDPATVQVLQSAAFSCR